MLFLYYLTLFAGLMNMVLGIIVLKHRVKVLNFSFFIFSLLTALWAYFNFHFFVVSSSLLTFQTQYAFGAATLASAVFWLSYLVDQTVSKLKAIFILIFGFIVFIIPYINSLVVAEIIRISQGEYSFKTGEIFDLYSLLLLIILTYLLIKVILAYRDSFGIRKIQLGYILVGLSLFAAASILFGLILPLFGFTFIVPFDAQSSLIWVGFTTYAIMRYHFMNVRFAITRSLLFSILITIVGTVITFSLILINQFISIESIRNTLIANFFIAVLIVAGLNPLKNRLAKLTDAIFFKNDVDPQEVLRIIGTAVARDLKLEELLVEFSNLFKDLIKLKKVQILIGDIGSKHFSIFNPSNSHTPSVSPPCQRGDRDSASSTPLSPLKVDNKDSQIIVDYFRENTEIKVTEEEERRVQDMKESLERSKLAALVQALNNIDMELVIPVSIEAGWKKFINNVHNNDFHQHKTKEVKKIVNAIILTGAKMNGEIFDNRDIKLYALLASQLSTAIEKSKLYEKVRHFNLALKEKVRLRTRDLQQAYINLKAANLELKQLDKAKSLFLSIAAHQLRTPLTGIKGYISMFLEGDFGTFSQEQTEILKGLFLSSNKLTRLINTFLNVSRIESGRLHLEKIEVDIKQLAQDILRNLQELAEEKNLKLELETPGELPLVLMDRDKIEEVISNLIDNAIKYTEKGKIILRLRPLGDKVRVEVQDTGIGISQEEATGLFKKFVRGRHALKLHTDGSGLGLFIVKKLVEAHEGVVGILSAGLGKGSIFWFEVPIEDNSKSKLIKPILANK